MQITNYTNDNYNYKQNHNLYLNLDQGKLKRMYSIFLRPLPIDVHCFFFL